MLTSSEIFWKFPLGKNLYTGGSFFFSSISTHNPHDTILNYEVTEEIQSPVLSERVITGISARIMQPWNRLSLYVRIWDIKKLIPWITNFSIIIPPFEWSWRISFFSFNKYSRCKNDAWFQALEEPVSLEWSNSACIYTWNSILYSMGLYRMWMSGEFVVSWLFLISGRTDFISVRMNTFKFNFPFSLFLPSAPHTIWRKGWKPLATPYWKQRVTRGYARENAALNSKYIFLCNREILLKSWHT